MPKMWNILCVLILGFTIDHTDSVSSDKLFPKFLPNFDQRHHHSKVTYLKDKQSGDYGQNNNGKIFFQKPEDKQKYKTTNSFDPYTDGYKQSWKTHRSEKYQTETIDNPFSNDPANKYIVKGVYQVREKLPYEDTTIGYDKEYHYPSSSSDIDSDYHTSAKFVDFHNAKNDPFISSSYDDYSSSNGAKILDSAKSKPYASDYEEFDPKKLEKVLESAKTDPYSSNYEEYTPPSFNPQNPVKIYSYSSNYGDVTPGKVGKIIVPKPQKQKAKPKQFHYHYKTPVQDSDYYKSVNLIDSYLAKAKAADVTLPLQDEPNEANDFGLNNSVDYGYSPPAETYKSSDYGSLGPSDIQSYQNYKTDGPSLIYLGKEFGDYS